MEGYQLINFNLSKFQNWRIVEMRDGDDVPRMGIFLPFLPNGIFLSKKDNMPRMRFLCCPRRTPSRYGCTHDIIPSFTRETYEGMISAGLVRVGDKRPATIVGYMAPWSKERYFKSRT